MIVITNQTKYGWVTMCKKCLNTGKYGLEKTLYLGTLHEVHFTTDNEIMVTR